MTVDIEQLYEMQRALDARIIKEKGLEGQDLIPNTVLALQVELGELANEWRGFKHWSNDRAPRYEKKTAAFADPGGPFENITYPLLEEYIDCFHFFLSIARQKDWLNNLYIPEDAIAETQDEGLDGGVGGALLEVMYWLLKMNMEVDRDEFIEEKLGKTKQEFCFRNAWFVFIAIGTVGFGFDYDQIAAAYMEKNKVNHERQSNGY